MPTLKLDFIESKPGGLPYDPSAYVALSEFTRDSSGTIYLTPECATPLELDTWVDILHKEL